MQSKLVDTTVALKSFLDGLPENEDWPPSLYVDLEGNDLSRNGTLSLLTILVEPEKVVYLIDVTTLRQGAFDVRGAKGSTLRAILESSETTKVFFDIRNDSDALYSLYGVSVGGIEDLQLMELASRSSSKKYVNGLAKCIERDTTLPFAERQAWERTKDRGRTLFDPAWGGSYAVFDQRPLSADTVEYCVQDVTFMPHLRAIYRAKFCDEWWRKIELETQARIRLSQNVDFNGKGRHMAEGPHGWLNWAPTAEQRASRTLFQGESHRRVETVVASGSQFSLDRLDGDGLERPSRIMESMCMPSERQSLWEMRDSSSDDGSEGYRDSDRYESDREDTFRDLTACDSECGYCGRCPY